MPPKPAMCNPFIIQGINSELAATDGTKKRNYKYKYISVTEMKLLCD